MTGDQKYFIFRCDRNGNEIYCSGITPSGMPAATRYTGSSTRREKRDDVRAGFPALQFSSARNAYEFAARHDVLKYWRVGRRDVIDQAAADELDELADVVDAWCDAGEEPGDGDSLDRLDDIGVTLDRPVERPIRGLIDGMKADERGALLDNWSAPVTNLKG